MPRFTTPEGHPAVGLTQIGPDAVLTIAGIGSCQYDPAEWDDVALRLRQAANMVEQNDLKGLPSDVRGTQIEKAVARYQGKPDEEDLL